MAHLEGFPVPPPTYKILIGTIQILLCDFAPIVNHQEREYLGKLLSEHMPLYYRVRS